MVRGRMIFQFENTNYAEECMITSCDHALRTNEYHPNLDWHYGLQSLWLLLSYIGCDLKFVGEIYKIVYL